MQHKIRISKRDCCNFSEWCGFSEITIFLSNKWKNSFNSYEFCFKIYIFYSVKKYTNKLVYVNVLNNFRMLKNNDGTFL